MMVELTPETSAEIDPDPAPASTQGASEGVQAGGGLQNLASFAQNPGQEAIATGADIGESAELPAEQIPAAESETAKPAAQA